MKRFILTLLLLFAICFGSSKAQDFYGTTDVKVFRQGRDKEMRDSKETALLATDFANFKGLFYYDLDDKFKVTAKFEQTVDKKNFQMPTSNPNLSRTYFKYGIVTFKIDGKEYKLNVYQSEKLSQSAEYKDLTNGTETYSGGRFLDLKAPSTNEITIDFNLTYNPSCAFGSEQFACPIPPKENFLQVEIKAGEKKYPHSTVRHKQN
jgi:uncharacterized protein